MPNLPAEQTPEGERKGPDSPDESDSSANDKAAGIEFLRRKFQGLHASPEAVSAANRTKKRTDENVSQKPVARIDNYLNRFQQILERPDEAKRDRGIEAFKKLMHRLFVIRPDDIPQSYWNSQARFMIRQGHLGDMRQAGLREEPYTNEAGQEEINYFFPEELKQQETDLAINNQKHSLDRWINYLSSPDALYPLWAKYWAFRSMLSMGKFEKIDASGRLVEGGEADRQAAPSDVPFGEATEADNEPKVRARFAPRAKDTVVPFPLLNPGALATSIGVMRKQLEAQKKPKADREAVPNKSKKLSDEEFAKLLATEDFSKLYAQFLIEMPEYSTEGLQVTEGQWVKYPQGSSPDPLVESMEGYPLEWCTRDPETARTQLEGGDFWVYYSLDAEGEPRIPRLAIRMEGQNKIAELPRGIAPDQNLDPYITPVLKAKLVEFGPAGRKFKKRADDTDRFNAIYDRHQAGAELTPVELRFLYELDGTIEGFGYEADLRIEDLKKERNIKADYAVIYSCREDQVIDDLRQLDADTRAYIGQETYKPLADVNEQHISQFSEVHCLTADLTQIDQAIKDQMKKWQGNLIDNSENVSYPNLNHIIGYFDAHKAEQFAIAMRFPLEERLQSQPTHYKRPDGIDAAKVADALNARPELQTTLLRMELSGGAPDIVAETDDAWIFADCSPDSPLRRRNLDWHQAYDMARRFGCQLTDEATYRQMQEEGEFDLNSWSWLNDDPAEVKRTGIALRGCRGVAVVDVWRFRAGVRLPVRGWRGLLRVPKA